MFKPYSWSMKINQIYNKVSTPGNKNEKDRRKNKKRNDKQNKHYQRTTNRPWLGAPITLIPYYLLKTIIPVQHTIFSGFEY